MCVTEATEDFFLHGGDYETSGRVKPAMCASCAFRNSPESVRPAGITIRKLETMSRDYDDFVCHVIEDPAGLADSCAGWHARFREARPSLV